MLEHHSASSPICAVDEAVDVAQLLQAGLRRQMDTGDQLELRFAEIGGDVRMRQRRAQAGRMRGQRERAVRANAQAFFFDPASECHQGRGRNRAQSFIEQGHGGHRRRDETARIETHRGARVRAVTSAAPGRPKPLTAPPWGQHAKRAWGSFISGAGPSQATDCAPSGAASEASVGVVYQWRRAVPSH